MNNRFFNTLCRPGIYGVFGKPRAGKSCLAAAVVAENNRRMKRYKSLPLPLKRFYFLFRPFFNFVYTTDESVKDAYHFDYADFGMWNVKESSLIILEEAGVSFNNRDWKTLSKEQKRLCAYIGHKKSTVLWLSQTADVDKVLRVRTHKLFLIKKFFGHRSLVTTIDYSFGVDNDSGELKDMYKIPEGFLPVIVSFIRRDTWFFNRKPSYKLFDSFEDTFKYKQKAPDDV